MPEPHESGTKIIGNAKIDRSGVGCSCFFGESHHGILVDKCPSVVYTCVHNIGFREVMEDETETFFNRPHGLRQERHDPPGAG